MTTASFEDFQAELVVVRAEILAESWSKSDTERALAYVAVLETTLVFLRDNPALALGDDIENARLAGWWDSWGRCAAGVVGGGIVGGLGGAAAGSAVPAIGTAIGGVAGAIGGGLTGAAASC